MHTCLCALSVYSLLSCIYLFSYVLELVLCRLFSILSRFVCLQKVSTLLLASAANCCPLTLPGIATPSSVQHIFTCTRYLHIAPLVQHIFAYMLYLSTINSPTVMVYFSEQHILTCVLYLLRERCKKKGKKTNIC